MDRPDYKLAGKSMETTARNKETLLEATLGEEFILKPDMVEHTERFGSDYGGWDIVTANLNMHSTIYSIGIGEDASFDTALIKKFGLTIHGFDPTPRSIEWVKKQGFSDRFVMHEYGIAAFDGTVSFNPPENPDHVSYTLLDRPSTEAKAISVPVKRLSTIMKELGHDRIDLLKMDVEGAEYDVIDDIDESNIRPQQFVVEFHHRFPGVGVKRTEDAINKLRSMGYGLFSVSATNEEFCFMLKSS